MTDLDVLHSALTGKRRAATGCTPDDAWPDAGPQHHPRRGHDRRSWLDRSCVRDRPWQPLATTARDHGPTGLHIDRRHTAHGVHRQSDQSAFRPRGPVGAVSQDLSHSRRSRPRSTLDLRVQEPSVGVWPDPKLHTAALIATNPHSRIPVYLWLQQKCESVGELQPCRWLACGSCFVVRIQSVDATVSASISAGVR